MTIAGWFLDRAMQFDWLMLLVYPEYVHTRDALDVLATNNRVAINEKHPGFSSLLDAWPNLKDRAAVVKIGRTYAYLNFGAEVRYEVGLVTFDREGHELQKDWTVGAARKIFFARADTRVLRVGGFVFFTGIVVSVLAAAAEFRAEKPTSGGSGHDAMANSKSSRRRRG